MVDEATATTVAQWMAEQVEEHGYLEQETAVWRIPQLFGKQFTYDNDSGNPAIDRKVLREFNKLTSETVVWGRGERCWRKRAKGDAGGRSQES